MTASPCWSCGRLTSGQTPGNKRDVAALETQAGSEVVPQLVVAGEVDDGGGYSHDSAHKQTRWAVTQQSSLSDVPLSPAPCCGLTVLATGRSTKTRVLRVD